MGRILGLDVGSKTIGVAISDEIGSIAFPGRTIIRQEGKKRDMASLRQLVAENSITEIVVGYPLMMDGTVGIQAESVESFVQQLRNSVRIPISLQDERLSTTQADRVLIGDGQRREKRKQSVDSIAASLILQIFLDKKRIVNLGLLEEQT